MKPTLPRRNPAPVARAWPRAPRRKPALITAGILTLLVSAAVLAWTHCAPEKDPGMQNAEVILQRVCRGEGKWVLSAEEVAILTRHRWRPDGRGTHLTLGSRVGEGSPSRLVLPFAKLCHHLHTCLRRRSLRVLFDLQLFGRHPDTRAALIDGSLHCVRLDPAVYILARRQQPALTPIAQELSAGQPEVRGAIIVRHPSSIATLADLKGHSFAFGAEQSALGSFLPKAALAAAGLRAHDFRLLTRAASDDVLNAVRTGVWDAGVVQWDDLQLLLKAGVPLRVLTELRGPSLLWVAAEGVDPSIVAVLRDTFLELRDPAVLNGLDHRLTGFTRPLAELDALAQAIQQAQSFDPP
ncbi:MAG: PhnD/SsuA/transferrin family substrate-binding protein [Verrucomicrobia bacterium]|nr:PhnD/SsuA/transferrin family substrate-binding protein [Verrucomicrobiota bacterium]